MIFRAIFLSVPRTLSISWRSTQSMLFTSRVFGVTSILWAENTYRKSWCRCAGSSFLEFCGIRCVSISMRIGSLFSSKTVTIFIIPVSSSASLFAASWSERSSGSTCPHGCKNRESFLCSIMRHFIFSLSTTNALAVIWPRKFFLDMSDSHDSSSICASRSRRFSDSSGYFTLYFSTIFLRDIIVYFLRKRWYMLKNTVKNTSKNMSYAIQNMWSQYQSR